MRIHGIHLQGIRAPQGEHRIAFDPGYTVIQSADAEDARALLRLIDALLHPAEAFGSFAGWVDPVLGGSARAGLSFSIGAEAYQLIADFEAQRLVLASYESASRSYTRISTDPDGIREHLARAGLPARADFLALELCEAGSLGVAVAPTPIAAPAASVEPAARPPAETRGALEARAERLRKALRRVAQLEVEEKELASELGARASAGDQLEDLDARIERYRERAARRAEEIAAVEAERRVLLEERSDLAAVPGARASGTWLGVALGAAGTAAGTLVHQAFYVAGLVGVLVALAGLALGRRARRGVGALEARLAGLRVREATIERRFESETQPLRALLHTLGVDSVEGLSDAGERYRALGGRHEALHAQLEEAQRDCPTDAAAQLVALEEQLSQSQVPAARPEAPLSEPPPAPRSPPAAGSSDPELRVRVAERLSSGEDAEFRARLTAVLPIYLRALTGGRYTRAWFDPDSGWSLRCEQSRERTPWTEALAESGGRLETALQLALLEVLARRAQLCLLVGPEPFAPGPALEPEEHEVWARALRRLAGALQVIQFSAGAGPWQKHAASTQRLASSAA